MRSGAPPNRARARRSGAAALGREGGATAAPPPRPQKRPQIETAVDASGMEARSHRVGNAVSTDGRIATRDLFPLI